jgi:hypothetical protein
VFKKRETRPKGASISRRPTPEKTKENAGTGYYNRYVDQTKSPCSCYASVVQCSWQTKRAFSICHVPAEAASRVIGGRWCVTRVCWVGVTVPHRTLDTVGATSSDLGAGVVVVEAAGLKYLHGQGDIELDVLSGNNRTNDQGEEDNEKNKVKNRIADDPALAKLGLLQRVDGRADLTTAAS